MHTLPIKGSPVFLYLFLTICCVGCDNGDDLPPEIPMSTNLLTVSVESTFTTADTDDWIILQDEAGTLLTFKSFESNDEFVLETDKTFSGNTIGITFLKIYEGTGHYYSLNSYMNVGIGKTAVLRTDKVPDPINLAGLFNVTVKDVEKLDQFSISSKLGSAVSHFSDNEDLLLGCILARNTVDYMLQLSDYSGNLKYKIFKDVKSSDKYILSLNEMSDFDTTVEFSFPNSDNVSLEVTGREAEQSFLDKSYLLSYHHTMDSHTKIKAGYLNTLSKYDTRLNIRYPNFDYSYTNVGSIPTGDIIWPLRTNFSIVTNSINNFSATSTVPFTWRKSIWRYDSPANSPANGILWNVSSPLPVQHLAEFPPEIVALHPVLAFENLEYINSTFYTQSGPYESYIDVFVDMKNDPFEPTTAITIW